MSEQELSEGLDLPWQRDAGWVSVRWANPTANSHWIPSYGDTAQTISEAHTIIGKEKNI